MSKINTKQLEEWGVANLGQYINNKIDIATNRMIVNFTNESIVLATEDDYHDEEVTAIFYKEKNDITNKSSNIFLADIDVYTTGVKLTLTNGKEIGLSIDYTEECDLSGSYADIPYTISLRG